MSCEDCHKQVSWYVLNHIGNSLYQDMAQRSVDLFNRIEHADLELFAPTHVVREEKDGKVYMKRLRLAYHYVFVRGELSDIKLMCSRNNGFSFLINHAGAERYAIVPDYEMYSFREIARAYENCLPYFSLADINLESGDLVEVINGDFPGLIGTFVPKPKSKMGNVVLMVDHNWGTVAYNINVADVRVLHFAANTTRAYDQIDAFVPNLLKALRCFHSNRPMTSALTSKLSVFSSRMEVVKLNNPKLDTKLQALLCVSNYLLGNRNESMHFLRRYRKRGMAPGQEFLGPAYGRRDDRRFLQSRTCV